MEDRVPSKQLIHAIASVRELLDHIPEGEASSTNAYTLITLNTESHLDPELKGPKCVEEHL